MKIYFNLDDSELELLMKKFEVASLGQVVQRE